MRISSKLVAFALTLSLLAAAPWAEAFCGFYVSGADAKLFNNATMVVMMRDGKRTVLSMQNNYQGPAENFAMVVPVPVVLQEENVKTLPREVFDRVDRLAAPRLVEYWEQDPCSPPMRSKGRGGIRPRTVMAPGASDSKAKAEDLGVTVEAEFTVGEYQIVILSAKDSGGLDTWLRQENYKIPEGAEPLLRPYVQEGMKFFVAKVDIAKVTMKGGQAMLSPLRFHYDDEKFRLPVRLGLVNSGGTQDLIVHILAKNKRYEVANYENTTIPTNIDVGDAVRERFGEFYAALFDATVADSKGAVVTEYSWNSSSCDPCPVPALNPNELATLGADVLVKSEAAEPGAPPAAVRSPAGGRVSPRAPRRRWRRPPSFVLTRLHARYGKDSLGEDLVFREADAIVGGREIRRDAKLEHGATKSSINNFQARYAIRHRWKGEVKCDEPTFGIWGGPPAGEKQQTHAATDLAFAKRGGVKLAKLVQSPVPELGLKGNPAAARADAKPAPSQTPPTTPGPATPVEAGEPGGSCGCRLVGPSDGRHTGALLFGFALMLLARRRKG